MNERSLSVLPGFPGQGLCNNSQQHKVGFSWEELSSDSAWWALFKEQWLSPWRGLDFVYSFCSNVVHWPSNFPSKEMT